MILVTRSKQQQAAPVVDRGKTLMPFFTFYGGKWRAAPHYPVPTYDTIIEPFAGAAGYAVRHHTKNVVLVEKDPVIASLWRYLIAATSDDIMGLPLIAATQSIKNIDVPAAAKSLIGFWLNKGAASPCHTPSAWMRGGTHPTSYWGNEIRERIASQVEKIAHWTVIEGDYTAAPEMKATWFVDPPYQIAGKHYKHSSKNIDFTNLAGWCRAREGQVMVCETEGAEWLPFTPFRTIKSTPGKHGKSKSKEALWSNHTSIS